MLFKAIRFYTLPTTFLSSLSLPKVFEELQENIFVPCGKIDKSKYGWVPPMEGYSDMLHHTVGSYMMFCAKKEEKILPSSVVNDLVEEKAMAIFEREGRKVFRKEKIAMKEEATLELLPKAFTKSKKIYGYLSVSDNMLVIDTTSPTDAEEFMAYLRKTLDGLPAQLPETANIPGDVMTNWVNLHRPAEGFILDGDCVFYNPAEDGNKITCKHQDLTSDEVTVMVGAGKVVKSLSVTWDESLSFTLDDELVIKQLKFGDLILEKIDEADAQDAMAQFDSDFAVMTVEISAFLKSLLGAFGGRANKTN